MWKRFLNWLWPKPKFKMAREPLSPEAQASLARLPFVGRLDEEQSARFFDLVHTFVNQVHWEGRNDLVVTTEMRLSVAAQACRLILGLHESAFRWVQTIYLFPSTYTATETRQGADGAAEVHESHRHGEAWMRGPVVLSWNAARHGVHNPDDGRNVVYHEFAHKLDMLDKAADGTPLLANEAQHDKWEVVFEKAFRALVQAKTRGKRTLLDKYGATNPAEFFAVATEVFFERPKRLRKKNYDLYVCLCRFYNQNPARNIIGLGETAG